MNDPSPEIAELVRENQPPTLRATLRSRKYRLKRFSNISVRPDSQNSVANSFHADLRVTSKQ